MNPRTTSHPRTPWALGCLIAALAGAPQASAIESGRTAAGIPFVSGGVSQEELDALHRQRGGYSLWVVTAATKSGAFLADVQLTVRDKTGRAVFEGRMDGPWLFVDLPLGRYEVEARFEGAVRRGVTTIHAGDHHQMFFYFDTGDATLPERIGPTGENLYGVPLNGGA